MFDYHIILFKRVTRQVTEWEEIFVITFIYSTEDLYTECIRKMDTVFKKQLEKKQAIHYKNEQKI